ncbi:reticulon-4-interacting protein 1, mitochondrial precursor [Zopfia rhizophila CBS 207.26]|uniref:Reticulon-4-interacting protein 1, mitochondrial n=1 Tax=Zopfia rhizophila CBS 207.26 TaxID=1314779 RepID=A0A6A6ERC8_9PEZI|nr:reticulon-4-interacting protein 1, mitochondrial precursor [Zopfia rhizophila CBS 207.26]
METMKAWLYTTASGGLEKNLYQPAAGAPKPKISDDQILVEVLSMALNPADYKVPEMALVSKFMISKPASPGADFCGRVAATRKNVDSLQVGELVFGAIPTYAKYGSLAQFIVASREEYVSMPEEIQIDDAASIGVAGLTAYHSIAPNVKDGDKIFVNGGSGGTGIFCIQIAKALGCHVTTSCSTANINLCKSLGADEVLDYKSIDIIKKLEEMGQVFSLVVDNVGSPSNLYKASTSFLPPSGKFVQVGMDTSLDSAKQIAGNTLLPGFLGGGKRKYEFLMLKNSADSLTQLGKWMKEGKIKAVIDSVFEFDDALKAIEKLKTGRARGKIVVHVSKGQ